MMVEKICFLKLKMQVYTYNIDEIWNKIKKTLNIRLHSQPVYVDKYIKA